MNIPVLLPKIFDYPLTYNNASQYKLKVGDFVKVPFGKQEEVGIVWDKISSTSKKIKIKNIINKIDGISLNKNLIQFINWFSIYNLVSKGMVLKMCIGNNNNVLKLEKKSSETISKKKKIFFLNESQKISLEHLNNLGEKFNVSVLQGVTGSGKTLVYFERIKKIIDEKKQVLLLLPEIFLTNQFNDRFQEYFGFEPSIWHSKISLKKKRQIWQGVINGKLKLVIGARSSLLLPFNNLGLIIVDEEHDTSYKQDEGIIYNARDMAISRASIENIPVHLITSVPSIETFNNIKKNKYNIFRINKRYSDFPLPKTKIVNLNESKLNTNEFIADETINYVKDFLKKKEQILFFLNRRGYAPFLICKICGFKHTCPNCSIHLTYHKSLNQLLCHYCGHKSKIKKECKKTKENCNFRMYGPGVEKIYEEIKRKFPNQKVKIFSSDFLSKKKEAKDLLSKIENNKINILIGTQMISKGFNFPKLNCIVVVDADFTGKGYDLRTTEKNIQLYNQLSGRAGRFSQNSLIVYQTIMPSDETLMDLLENDPEKFLNNELILRKKNNLPPFVRLIGIIISSDTRDNSLNGAIEIKNKLSQIKELKILGPVDSPIFKVKKKYRTRLLVKSKTQFLIQKRLTDVLKTLNISKKIKLTVDVDPINFI